MDKFLLNDSKGVPSVTMTAFVIGFIVVNLKLLLSGLTIGGINISAFGGTEYGVAISALGAIYVLRRATDQKGKGDDNTETK